MTMSGLKKSMLAAALAVGFLSQDSAQAAPTQTVLRYKDLSASASFRGSDECSSTDVYISGFTNVSSSGGKPRTSTDGVYVSYSTFNWCTGEYTYGYGFTEDASVTGTPRHVDVSATVPIEEYSAEGGPVLRTMTVNLSFAANGDYTSHGVNNYTYSTPSSAGITAGSAAPLPRMSVEPSRWMAWTCWRPRRYGMPPSSPRAPAP
jgi:hypothetical protein